MVWLSNYMILAKKNLPPHVKEKEVLYEFEWLLEDD